MRLEFPRTPPATSKPSPGGPAEITHRYRGRALVDIQVISLALAVALALALSGCRDTSDAEVEALASPTPSPTTEPKPDPEPEPEPEPEPDAFAIPDDPAAIDEAYLLGVLNALFAAETDRYRHQVTTRVRDDEWNAWIAALYTPEQRDFQAFVFDDVAQADDWHIYKPADQVRDITIPEITQMITISPECVFVAAPWDPSTIAVDPQQPPLAYIALVPHHGQADPDRNPTPWWFVDWSGYDPGLEPQNFCA